MEPDWQEVTRIGFPSPGIHAAATPVTTFAFDNTQELVWAGNGYGRTTSFHGAELQRYTSYRSNHPREGPVRQIILCDRGVISVASRSVHLSIRRGITMWHLTQDEFRDLRCICFAGKSSSDILAAGCQDTMFKIDVEKGEVIETVQAPEHYTLFKRGGQYICAATATGSVQLLDQSTFAVLKSWKAHAGWINDMDANNSFLLTCGWSPRQHFGNLLDPLAKVFDLKTLMPLPPVPFHAGAAFVRMHPRMLTTAIISSQAGQIQLVDIMNSAMVTVRQVSLVQDSYLLGLDVACSGEALALTDTMCTIHLWASPSKLQFTPYSNPTEFADHPAPERTTLDVNNNAPLNSIGMPFYRELLLSSWPSHMTFSVGVPPLKLDPLVANNLTRAEIGGYAPNPRKTRRNQVINTRSSEGNAGIEAPKFLSEQAKEGDSEPDAGRRMSEVLDSLEASNLDGVLKIDVPVMYRNVEIKYSKFGIEDFDFEYYNKTKFSGLETHIANSYTNPLLQLLKFTPWIRNLALHHTASSCLLETCLLCEMGFLFDMLEKANGQNCQATNFLRVFGGLPHTASLGLLEDGLTTRPLAVMLQSVNRFLLEKMVADYRQILPQVSGMDHALTTVAMNSIRCTHCANETVRPGATHVNELIYPAYTSQKNRHRSYGPTFSQILKASVERHEQTRGWCDRCRRYQQLAARKTVQSIPPVLTINAAVHSEDARLLWSRKNWLPQEIGIIVDQGQFFCYEGQDLAFHLQRGNYRITVYDLIGFVADINSGENQKSHLVSMINTAPSERASVPENSWYLFNDFLVRQVSTQEALRFDHTWKTPVVLTYQVKSARHYIDDTWKENLETSLLFRKWNQSQHRSSDESSEEDANDFSTLSYPKEKPQPGTPVGIDAEFVALQQEEIEVKADGTRSVLRPPRLGLARVSVLRGGSTEEDLRADSSTQDGLARSKRESSQSNGNDTGVVTAPGSDAGDTASTTLSPKAKPPSLIAEMVKESERPSSRASSINPESRSTTPVADSAARSSTPVPSRSSKRPRPKLPLKDDETNVSFVPFIDDYIAYPSSSSSSQSQQYSNLANPTTLATSQQTPAITTSPVPFRTPGILPNPFAPNVASHSSPTHQSPQSPYPSNFPTLTTEPIIDYLTPYSGISPGDLSPTTSPYASTGHLVTLKTAYKKIWLLLNLGCVFVGHGLPKDFRTINIHVPKKQVIDTVDLFFLPKKYGRRRLGLKFLCWCILGEVVQRDEGEIAEFNNSGPASGSADSDNNNNGTNDDYPAPKKENKVKGHDSIEDARTALRLWKVWKKFENESGEKLEDVLEEVYRRGREVGFKVPTLYGEAARAAGVGVVGSGSGSLGRK